MSKSWTAALAALALAAAAPAADARLTAQEARHNVRVALSETLENAWNYGEGRSIRCSRRSPRAVSCRLQWFIGDGSYRGRVRATETSRRRSVVGTVVVIDQYCLHVSRAGNCTSNVPVRWHRPVGG
jgi:hypothetical protein